MNIAEVLMQQGHHEEAEPMLTDAIRVCAATGFRDGEASATMYLGRLLVARGDAHDGEVLLGRAAEAFLAMDARTSVAEAHLFLGESWASRGESDAALALADTVEQSAPGGLFDVSLARVRVMALARLGRAGEALDYVARGTAEARRQGLLYDIVFFVAARAELERRIGVDPDPAFEQEATDLARDLGLRAVPSLGVPENGATTGGQESARH
jgi:tetratricopeptide (TPR) repeat protein